MSDPVCFPHPEFFFSSSSSPIPPSFFFPFPTLRSLEAFMQVLVAHVGFFLARGLFGDSSSIPRISTPLDVSDVSLSYFLFIGTISFSLSPSQTLLPLNRSFVLIKSSLTTFLLNLLDLRLSAFRFPTLFYSRSYLPFSPPLLTFLRPARVSSHSRWLYKYRR